MRSRLFVYQFVPRVKSCAYYGEWVLWGPGYGRKRQDFMEQFLYFVRLREARMRRSVRIVEAS